MNLQIAPGIEEKTPERNRLQLDVMIGDVSLRGAGNDQRPFCLWKAAQKEGQTGKSLVLGIEGVAID